MKISVSMLRFVLPLAVCSPALVAQTAAISNYFTLPSNYGVAGEVILASDGNIYGVAAGPLYANGFIYRMYPDGTFQVVADLSTNTDQYAPYGPESIIEGNDGNFYVSTYGGGDGDSQNGIAEACLCGTVLRVTPQGVVTTLVSYDTSSGQSPNHNMFQGPNGYLYTTNRYGISEVNLGGGLEAFSASNHGFVQTGAILGSDGELHGTTLNPEHIYDSPLSLPSTVAYSATYPDAYIYTTFVEGGDHAYYVAGPNDWFRYTTGATPKIFETLGTNQTATNMFSASDGNIYGTATTTGSSPVTTVYRITPAATPTTTALTTTGIVPLPQYGASSFVPVQLTDGSFIFPVFDTANVLRTAISPALPAPVQLTPSATTITLGQSFTMNWKVLNAASLQMQQCSAFLKYGGTGGGWGGLQTGTAGANGLYSGSANITPTAGGTFTYALTCGGVESGFATVNVTGGTSQSGTSTFLSSPVSQVKQGDAVTLNAIVRSATGGYIPTGNVVFKSGGVTLGTAKVNAYGLASFTASSSGIPAGNYTVSATYQGDSNDTASSSNTISFHLMAPVKLSFTPMTQNISIGTNGSITVTLKPFPGSPTPTGEVTVYCESNDEPPVGCDNSADIPPSGVVVIPLLSQNAPTGIYPMTVTYQGDSFNEPATVTGTLNIGSSTTTTLATSSTNVTNGVYVGLTATVAEKSAPPSGGNVTFQSGSMVLGSAAVNAQGVAGDTFLVQGVPPGTYPVTAYYGGTPTDGASTSNTVQIKVSQ